MVGSPTRRIYLREDIAFVPKGSFIPSRIEDLDGMSVILNQQYQYAKGIKGGKNNTIIYANTDVNGMAMLSKGRGEVFIAEKYSGIAVLDKSGAKNITYNLAAPISKIDAVYLFQDNERGKHLAREFTNAINEIIADGTYLKLFGRWSPEN